MKNTVLAKPNLKGIFFGTLLLAAIAQLFSGDSTSESTPVRYARAQLDDQYLSTLLQKAAETPNADLYTRISIVYEQKKKFRRALFFLREADRLTEWADN